MNANYTLKTALIHENLKQFILIIFTLFYFSTTTASAGNLNLVWDASTSTNVGGYKLYYGTKTASYTNSVDVGNTTTYQMTGLQDGTTYFFALKSYNLAKTIESGYSNEVNANIPSGVAITVDFSASNTSGDTGMIVSFTPLTTGTITGWLWNFGDGGTSTAQNPTHTYNVAGVYPVSLTVSGSVGTATKTVADFITVNNPVIPPPVASFSASTTTGIAPKSIAFTDTSTGDVSGWTWDFGDGSTSTVQNPTHAYNTPGTYSVSLTASGAGGSDTMDKIGLITISQPIATKNGLVAAYNFEGSSTTTVVDVSGLGNNGVVNGPKFSADGRYGKGMLFDGVNDIVSVNDSASLDLSTGFTLEAWVKPLSINRSSVMFKTQAGGSVYELYAYEDADLAISSFNDGTNYQVVRANNPLRINRWTYVVSTYDGQYLRLYLNGYNVSVIKATTPIKQSNGVLQIGGDTIWGEYFNGSLDEIRIYNRALSKVEIRTDMQTPVK